MSDPSQLYVARRLARSAHNTRDATAIQENLLEHAGRREVQAAQEGMFRTHHFRLPCISTGMFKKIDCKFSFAFLHRPQFTYSYIISDDSEMSDRYPPIASAVVVDWLIPDGDDADVASDPGVQWAIHYGARVEAQISGVPLPTQDLCLIPIRQRGVLQLSFTGQAIVYPVNNAQTLASFSRTT